MLLQADTTLDNATLALATVTGILALGTIGTAVAALWQARSTAASVNPTTVLTAPLDRCDPADDGGAEW